MTTVETDNESFDKNRLAIALKYERDKSPAPVVAAKGKGYMAQQIIEIAERYGIEIREDKDLAQMLEKLDIDTPIPLEAYAAVASGAQVQAPFELPMRWGNGAIKVGWAIVRPEPTKMPPNPAPENPQPR